MTQWILTSSVLILLVIAVRGLFKEKMKAQYTYALWLVVLVRLLCPVNFGELSFNLLSLAEEGKSRVEEQMEARESVRPEAEAGMSREEQKAYFELHGIRYVESENPTRTADYLPESSDGLAEDGRAKHFISAEVIALEAESTPASQQEISGFRFPAINWQKVLPVVWVVGMVVLAVVIVSVNISFSTRLGLFRKEVPAFSKKGQGSRKLPVYLVDGITSSCLYGVVRPSIYLNRKEMGEQEERYCIEHEYSHYLQGDMLWSVCRIVCLILHWYNPLVWLAVMLSKKDAELACDERTIERLGEEERYSYGHTLVELAAKQSRAVQMFSMATLMASDKKEVVERVKAIAIKKQTKIITGLLVVCLLVGIGCFIFTGVAKGEQDNDKNAAPVVTETPVPTKEATEDKPVATATEAPVLTENTKAEVADTTAKPTPMPSYVLDVMYNAQDYRLFREYVLENNEFPVQGLVIANKLNVRTGAGKDYDIITTISKDTEVTILGVTRTKDECWYEISFNEEYPTAYVLSSYIAWAGSFRLYESPEENSAYCTLDYHSGEVRGVVDAGSEWFYVETEDYQSGWVRYGEHGGVDESIRDILSLTESEWDMVREKKKKENILTLTEEVKYTPLSFVDHVALERIAGEGWLVDLNGDGEQEKLYINENGVYINGEKEFMYASPRKFWLLDIDTTDNMYEMLTGNGTLYIYDGKDFRNVKGVEAYLVPGESAGNGAYVAKRQIATLSDFTRIDEHTISFEDCFRDIVPFFAEAHYTLDENHNLQVVPQDYEIQAVKQQIDRLLYGVEYHEAGVNGILISEIKVYTERNLDSDYTEVSWLEDVKLLKSDCVEWIYAETADGISGWLYYDKNQQEEYVITYNTSE